MKVIDLHCDTLMALNKSSLLKKDKKFNQNDLHIDLEKLKKGDYLLQCFAAFVDFEKSPESPLLEVLQEIDIFHQIMDKYAADIAPVYQFSDIRKNKEEGKISGLLTIEDGGVCMGDLSVLRMLHRLGARMMTLTWNYENTLGSPATPFGKVVDSSNKGLKEQGIAFLSEMERLGMIIDVSHLSDEGFLDVAKYTHKPFLASHSNSRIECPHPRNLTDDMLRVLANRGGIVGMNFYFDFLDNDLARLKERGTAEAVVDHIEHIRKVAGLDIIALGSDFDGIDQTLELKDASKMGILVTTMEKRGFTASEIEKVFNLNAMRFFEEML
ncbi:MAG: dipeptidase [Clostridiaceae bacterium]